MEVNGHSSSFFMCLIPGKIASIAHQITRVDPRAFVAMVVVFCEIKPGSYSPQ
jgi:hypothetical protein